MTNTKASEALTSFSGIKKGRNIKLWEVFKNTHNQYKSVVNSSMSLNDDSQREIRNSLLMEGNQDVYEWKFVRLDFAIAFDINSEGLYNRTVYYLGEKYVDINFKLSFVNINFRVDGIWDINHWSKVVMEKKSL